MYTYSTGRKYNAPYHMCVMCLHNSRNTFVCILMYIHILPDIVIYHDHILLEKSEKLKMEVVWSQI